MKDLDRLQLFTESRGAGPSMVWAHGFAGSARNFRPQARAFESSHKVLLFDARGHARSPAPEDENAYAFEYLVSDLEHLIAGGDGQPVVLGGLSLGARTALAVALRGHSPVRGLILAALPGALITRRPWALGFADSIAQEGLEAAGERFVWGQETRLDPRARAWVRQGFLEHQPHALMHLLRRALAELPDLREFSDVLTQLSVPTLIIAGSRDADAVREGEALACLLPNARLLVVDGAGHVVNLEQPEAFNRGVATFLSELS